MTGKFPLLTAFFLSLQGTPLLCHLCLLRIMYVMTCSHFALYLCFPLFSTFLFGYHVSFFLLSVPPLSLPLPSLPFYLSFPFFFFLFNSVQSQRSGVCFLSSYYTRWHCHWYPPPLPNTHDISWHHVTFLTTFSPSLLLSLPSPLRLSHTGDTEHSIPIYAVPKQAEETTFYLKDGTTRTRHAPLFSFPISFLLSSLFSAYPSSSEVFFHPLSQSHTRSLTLTLTPFTLILTLTHTHSHAF